MYIFTRTGLSHITCRACALPFSGNASTNGSLALRGALNGSQNCWDCMRNRTGPCAHFFVWTPTPPAPKQRRRLAAATSPSASAARRERLSKLMDRACCRVHKVTGARDCSRHYCHKAVHGTAHARG